MVLEIIRAAAHLDPADPAYPIHELCRYQTPIRLMGFAASPPIEIRFGAVLKTTFAGVDGQRASVAIEYRVVPQELDSSRAILLSARTVGPEGLDIRTAARHHEVGALGLRCRTW